VDRNTLWLRYLRQRRPTRGLAFKLNSADAERLLLDYIDTDLLSPEAIEHTVTEWVAGLPSSTRSLFWKRSVAWRQPVGTAL